MSDNTGSTVHFNLYNPTNLSYPSEMRIMQVPYIGDSGDSEYVY